MTYKINGVKVTKKEWDALPNKLDYDALGTPSIGGFTAFQSPIDGEKITNSKQLREHEVRHDVIQVGNEYEKQRKRKEQ